MAMDQSALLDRLAALKDAEVNDRVRARTEHLCQELIGFAGPVATLAGVHGDSLRPGETRVMGPRRSWLVMAVLDRFRWVSDGYGVSERAPGDDAVRYGKEVPVVGAIAPGLVSQNRAVAPVIGYVRWWSDHAGPAWRWAESPCGGNLGNAPRVHESDEARETRSVPVASSGGRP
jgi:hypothetical protein